MSKYIPVLEIYGFTSRVRVGLLYARPIGFIKLTLNNSLNSNHIVFFIFFIKYTYFIKVKSTLN